MTVNDVIKEKFEEYINLYGEDRILWVAATGQPDLWSSSKILIPVSACYLPTQQELYMTIALNFTNDENIIDIRLLKDNLEELVLAPYKYINPKYEDLLTANIFLNKDIFKSDEALYHAIYNIINHSFDVPSNEQELINILTKTEIKVLNNIINEFVGHNEGDIRVSYCSEQWNISTSVFRTLFYKLKEYHVAEVDSRGVKGTHIKFNNIKTLYLLVDKNK